MILVTGHRRESFGRGFEQICHALAEIAAQNSDVQIVYPVHLNPNVSEPVNRILGHIDNIILIEPQDYLPFVWLMNHAWLILTDSGGIQEEAPSLGKPVLVMRETTERPEAVKAGTVRLVGTDMKRIVDEVTNLLHDEKEYQAMSTPIILMVTGRPAAVFCMHLNTIGYRYEFYNHLCHWSWLHWTAYCGSLCIASKAGCRSGYQPARG